MNTPESSAPGTDWTKLLKDPEIASHLGELLKAYREAPPDKRDQALLAAMGKIKSSSQKANTATAVPPAPIDVPHPVATEPDSSPPFEPDIFTPSWGQDRRRYPRMKCFVAVELRMDGATVPVWGNLANTSMGGCFVETATPLHAGAKLEIGLWVANGKIWVKGLVIDGVIIESSPSFGVRIKFSQLANPERESLRQFLKFVENTTKGYHLEHGYLAQLKR
jgi:hypothetical protein